ncbi:lipoprotein [Streptomyces aureus]
MQHGRAARAVAAAATVGLMGLATGCSAAAEADNESPAESAAAVHDAADRLVREGSSKARTSMEMASGGTRVTIRGEGVYDYRARVGQLKVVLPQDPSGAEEHRPITELLVPGALYMKNRGAGVPADKWVRVDTATMSDGNLVTGGATDPLAAAELLRGARKVTYVGESELAGTEVRHYRGTVDMAAAARAASPASRQSLAAAAKGFAKDQVPFDVYLDDEGRIRKVCHRFSFVNTKVTAAGKGGKREVVDVASTTLLDGFGISANIELPDTKDIFAGKIADN